MKLIDWSSLDAAGKRAALARPAQRTAGDVTDVLYKQNNISAGDAIKAVLNIDDKLHKS